MSHRASFWKTISLAVIASLLFASAAPLAIYLLGSPFGWVVAAILFVPAVAALAVVLGGLLCLHRDSRQQAGRPDLFYSLTRPSPRRDGRRRYRSEEHTSELQ